MNQDGPMAVGRGAPDVGGEAAEVTDAGSGGWRSATPQVLRGYCMGAADIVPGVSGGTVALVFGIYERLVHNVRTGAAALGRFVRADGRGGVGRLREVEWTWLLPLLAGIGLAVVSLVRVIRFALDDYPVETSAVFFGLISASIVVAWRLLRRPAPVHGLVIAGVAAGFFALLGLRADDFTDPSLWLVLGAGAIATCAMILPGISGSFILLMLGMYEFVIAAVDERDLLVVAVFACGAVIGLALFSSVLDWLLRHHHDLVLAGLVGLMLGSLRVLWPWPVDETGDEYGAALGAPPAGEWIVPLLLALGAASVVLLVAARAGGPRADRAPSPQGAA